MTNIELQQEKDWAMNLESKAELRGALIGAGLMLLLILISLA